MRHFKLSQKNENFYEIQRKTKLSTTDFFGMGRSIMYNAKKPIKIFVMTPFVDKSWRWLELWFDKYEYKWVFHQADLERKSHKKVWWWVYHTFKAARRVDDSYDLVITHGPWLTLYMSIMMSFLRKKNRLIAFTFNHGNKIFFSGIFFKLSQKYMLPKVSLYMTYSEQERKIYSQKYNIPMNKIAFSHWAVAKPKKKAALHSYLKRGENYICTMGRNNRDNDLFIKVVIDLPVKAVLICREGQVNMEKIKGTNIIVRTDISMEECLQIMANSLINVVPLIDASTGAGHMTIVNTMLCGVPQVITKASTVEEYFTHNEHGFFVEQGDVEAMKDALLKIIMHPELRKKFSTESEKFADQWLTEEAAYRSLKAVVDCIKSGEEFPLAPPNWKLSGAT